MTIAHRQPVIVGVGEVADRPEDLVRALDPADLMAHALWAADRDAGGGMIAALDRLALPRPSAKLPPSSRLVLNVPPSPSPVMR